MFSNHFTTNFSQNAAVKKFWKSVNIWQTYGQKFMAYFFGPPCIYCLCARSAFPIQSCIPNLKSLAQVVFEILHYKRNGVTSLTFQGHVMSSVTWPFDCPYAIFLLVVLWNQPLSATVSEIFNVKCNAMVDVTLIRPLDKGQGHSFWYQSISHIRLPIGSQ